ncbi:hypothetical protein [Donghicola sp. XS_ASV15]|uniref:hypothetical protein n=1 Tax=Donghicola sp. XS_ASV15 TaxID=3241295 RepID=UPI0035180BE5
MFDLDGKVCLITGGAGSIGLAAARALAAQGARLALVDLDPAALDHACDDAFGERAAVEPPFVKAWEPEQERTTLDIKAAGITSVLWAIGFRPDYSWIEPDVFDQRGKPIFKRGVTEHAGLHFIGLGWLNTWGSGRFLGIEEDSRHLADQIVERQRVLQI